MIETKRKHSRCYDQERAQILSSQTAYVPTVGQNDTWRREAKCQYEEPPIIISWYSLIQDRCEQTTPLIKNKWSYTQNQKRAFKCCLSWSRGKVETLLSYIKMQDKCALNKCCLQEFLLTRNLASMKPSGAALIHLVEVPRSNAFKYLFRCSRY